MAGPATKLASLETDQMKMLSDVIINKQDRLFCSNSGGVNSSVWLTPKEGGQKGDTWEFYVFA